MKLVHPIFHISQLEPSVANTILNQVQPPLPLVEVDSEPMYEISEILNFKIHCKKTKLQLTVSGMLVWLWRYWWQDFLASFHGARSYFWARPRLPSLLPRQTWTIHPMVTVYLFFFPIFSIRYPLLLSQFLAMAFKGSGLRGGYWHIANFHLYTYSKHYWVWLSSSEQYHIYQVLWLSLVKPELVESPPSV